MTSGYWQKLLELPLDLRCPSHRVLQASQLLGQNFGNLIMFSALNFIGKVDASPGTYLMHQEMLIFLSIAMSTQLRSGPTPGPNDTYSFTDAAMSQEISLVNLVVRKLFLNYITRPQFPINNSSSSILSEENQRGVLRRVGSATANLMLLPFNYLGSSTCEASRSPLAESSLNVIDASVWQRKRKRILQRV